jgi:hypothetical protein
MAAKAAIHAFFLAKSGLRHEQSPKPTVIPQLLTKGFTVL